MNIKHTCKGQGGYSRNKAAHPLAGVGLGCGTKWKLSYMIRLRRIRSVREYPGCSARDRWVVEVQYGKSI
jgi:hypothetical protein